jgi:hypothetical protein
MKHCALKWIQYFYYNLIKKICLGIKRAKKTHAKRNE